MAAFAVSRGQLARLLAALAVWCDAHKMRINVSGVVKTAAMFFSATDAHAPLPAPLGVNMPDGTVLEVPFTQEYTYVGFPVHASLDPERLQNYIISRTAGLVRQFRENVALRRCNLQTQRTYLTSTVLACTGHLLVIVSPSAGSLGSLASLYL